MSIRLHKKGFIQHHSNGAGFTLIEVLVAATIIAVLTAIGVVSYSNINKKSRDAKRKSDIEQIRSALEMYRADNGYYPPYSPSPNFWRTDNTTFKDYLVTSYMPAVPTDPKNANPYVYRYQATDKSGTRYYGYCLSALLEQTVDPDDTCTPYTSHNYGVKSP